MSVTCKAIISAFRGFQGRYINTGSQAAGTGLVSSPTIDHIWHRGQPVRRIQQGRDNPARDPHLRHLTRGPWSERTWGPTPWRPRRTATSAPGRGLFEVRPWTPTPEHSPPAHCHPSLPKIAVHYYRLCTPTPHCPENILPTPGAETTCPERRPRRPRSPTTRYREGICITITPPQEDRPVTWSQERWVTTPRTSNSISETLFF